MRISDWSSDVCSSDLELADALGPAGDALGHDAGRGGAAAVVHRRVDVLTVDRQRDGLAQRQVLLATDQRVPVVEHEVVRAEEQRVERRLVVGLGLLDEGGRDVGVVARSEEHTSELQSLMRISYAVFCLKKKKK